MKLKPILAALLLAVAFFAPAAPARAASGAQAEIEHLLDYIARSSCRFNRNGSWHGMEEARSHITMKYEYLRDLGKARDAESFIEEAAAGSSMSGKNYLVQCPGEAAMPSAAWLKTELARFRERPRG
jgi:hypothetical protein